MTGFTLTVRDMMLLQGVHEDLVKVIRRAAAISPIKFKITEGLRDVKRQRQLVDSGASTTMNSRHLTGHAVDLVPLLDVNGDGKVDTNEMYSWPVYHQLAPYIKKAASELNIPLEWGGDWRKFKDGPHWQLPFSSYPRSSQPRSLMGVYSGVDSAMVTGEPEYTLETDTQAHSKAMTATITGSALGVSVGYEPVVDTVTALTMQQGELTSGNIVRILLAVVIIGLPLWYAWRKR